MTHKRLLFAVTHPMTARHLLRGQLGWLRRQGLEVGVVASPGPQLAAVAEEEGVAVFPVPMRRGLSPLRDLPSLARLLRVMRSFRPDVVHASTPKAGLLGTLAATLAGVPHRVYLVRGLRLEGTRGLSRPLLAASERLASRLAHRVVCVGPSLERRYRELRLAPAGRTTVLGPGSSNGVDAERFHPRRRQGAEAGELRRRLEIPAGAPVVGFVGRLTRDKGIADLADAFLGEVMRRRPDARLLLLGDYEEGDPVPIATRDALAADPRVVRSPFTDDSAPYYGLMDVLAFPSYREGFPNAPLEAAATAAPVVGYRATGTVDAVMDGATGALVGAGDVAALAAAILRYLDDSELRAAHGLAGRRRVEEHFRQELVWERWLAFYRGLLAGAAPATEGAA